MKRIFIILLLISLVAVIGFTGCVMKETEVGEVEKKALEVLGRGTSWRTISHSFQEVSGGKWSVQSFKVFVPQIMGKIRENFKLGKIQFHQIQDLKDIAPGPQRGFFRSCPALLEVRDVIGSDVGASLASCETNMPNNCIEPNDEDCNDVEENPEPEWYGCQPLDENGDILELSTQRYYYFGIKYKNPTCIHKLIHHIGGDGLADTEAVGSDNGGGSWGRIGENEEYVRIWDWDEISNALGDIIYSHDSIFENGDFERGTTSSWYENPAYNQGKIDIVEIMTGPELRLEWDNTNGCNLLGNHLDLSASTAETMDGTYTEIELSDYLNIETAFINSWIKFSDGTNEIIIDCTITGDSEIFYDTTEIERDEKQHQIGTSDLVARASRIRPISSTWDVVIAKKINADVKEGKYALKLLRDVSYLEEGSQRIQVEQDEEINDEYEYYLDAWTYADTNMENGSAMGLILTTGTTQSEAWQNEDAVYLVTHAHDDMIKGLCDTYLNFVCINRLGTCFGDVEGVDCTTYTDKSSCRNVGCTWIGTALTKSDGTMLTEYTAGEWIHIDDMPLDELFYQNITYKPFHFSICFRPPCSPAPPPRTILAEGLHDTLRVKPAMGSTKDKTMDEKYTAAFFDEIHICAVKKGTETTGDICGN